MVPKHMAMLLELKNALAHSFDERLQRGTKFAFMWVDMMAQPEFAAGFKYECLLCDSNIDAVHIVTLFMDADYIVALDTL